MKLIEYLTSKDAQIEYCKKTGNLPVVKSAYEDLWIKENRLRAESGTMLWKLKKNTVLKKPWKHCRKQMKIYIRFYMIICTDRMLKIIYPYGLLLSADVQKRVIFMALFLT